MQIKEDAEHRRFRTEQKICGVLNNNIKYLGIYYPTEGKKNLWDDFIILKYREDLCWQINASRSSLRMVKKSLMLWACDWTRAPPYIAVSTYFLW